MKKVTSILLVSILSITAVFAQDGKAKFYSTMKSVVEKIQTTPFQESLFEHSNKMERIAQAEPNEWLPNYWVAYCQVFESIKEQDKDKKDLLLDKAEEYLEKATALSNENDEILQLWANYANARMIVNPMVRWMKYGSMMEEYLEEASAINSDNPRIQLLQAESVYYTPESFGGGKEKAKPMLENAIALYETFTPKNEMYPNWGESTARYYLSQYENQK